VRPPDEYAAVHIPGAINAAPDTVDRMFADLGRDAQIVVNCCGPCCIYVHHALAALRRHGLDAPRLDGGLQERLEEGRPIASAAA
jgi:ArsR family transcriptional regulator